MHSSISLRKVFLYKSVVDNGHKFEAAVVPEDLIGTVLHLGLNQSGVIRYHFLYTCAQSILFCYDNYMQW